MSALASASSTPAPLGGRPPLTYKGERVLTTELAAEAFGAVERQLRDNASANAARFEINKHFFKVEGAELRALKDSADFTGSVGANAKSLTLWTERGVARHAKILDTDTAWDIFEALEDTYFRVKDGAASQAPTIPDFGDPAAAARAWAEQYEARVEAERRKAEIGSRREATAMATASRESRRADRLLIELDQSHEYATVKRMQAAHPGQQFDWRTLKRLSIDKGIPVVEVFDANYGKVNSYHVDVWREAYPMTTPQSTRERRAAGVSAQ